MYISNKVVLDKYVHSSLVYLWIKQGWRNLWWKVIVTNTLKDGERNNIFLLWDEVTIRTFLSSTPSQPVAHEQHISSNRLPFCPRKLLK